MAFRITITGDAERQFGLLSARNRRTLNAAISSRLTNQPTTPTRAIKQLRPNPFAQFELRVGDRRVLYNIEGDEVVLPIVGQKVGEKLIVEGEEFYEHQDDSAERTGSESEEGAQ
jgi:mRNA-degrading endonuclease RelE of RelBE toxin-antitoxin system